MSSFNDMYGHDRRMLDALNGKSIAAIAAADPAAAQLRENKALQESVASIEPQRARPRPLARAQPRLASAKVPSVFGFYKPQPSYLRRAPSAPKPFFSFFQ